MDIKRDTQIFYKLLELKLQNMLFFRVWWKISQYPLKPQNTKSVSKQIDKAFFEKVNNDLQYESGIIFAFMVFDEKFCRIMIDFNAFIDTNYADEACNPKKNILMKLKSNSFDVMQIASTCKFALVL